ncbi:hypothetical protein BKA61DRAFT_572878 [Leptodontidium sp. MPI-SDFR-AT-0119]|nr:hypothetical protein BKA61DRAFT_572878 [Leptodontidium sp. MPI-SDFR-AT-0119]
MVNGRSTGSKLQPSKDSVKKTQKTYVNLLIKPIPSFGFRFKARGHKFTINEFLFSSKSSAADVKKAPRLPNSKTSTKNNPTGGTTDITAAIAYGDQTSYNDTSIPNVPALTQTPFEDGNSIEYYSHRAATDSIVEISINQLQTPRNHNAVNPQSNTAYHEGVHTSVSAEPRHNGEGDQAWMNSEDVEANRYQLGLWTYETSSESITIAERLEKSNWTCAREERL